MALTYKIKTGDALDAALVTANFADLETMIEDVQPSDIEPGAIWHRHLSTTESWKEFQTVTVAGPVVLGALAIIAPAAPAAFNTVAGQAYVVKCRAVLLGTGVTPRWGGIHIYVGGASVISRRWDLPNAATRQHVAIAFMVTAGAATTTIELRAEGAACNIYNAHLDVLVFRR